MKTVFLVRHAKSSWGDPSQPDLLRPLNKRGLHDAPVMGKHLAKLGVQPDLIVSSPAARAIATAQLLAPWLGYPPGKVLTDDRLYGTTADEIQTVLSEMDSRKECVMLIGHNPMLDELVDRFTSGKVTHLPTCGVVSLEFTASGWSEISLVKPNRVKFYRPKASKENL